MEQVQVIQRLVFGGNPAPGLYTRTENFDGTSWTEVADLSLARQNMSSHIGSTTLALATGGHDASDRTASTEEFSFPPITATVRQEGQLYFKGGALKGFEKAGGIPSVDLVKWGNLVNQEGRAGFASNASSTTHIAMTFGGNVGPGTPGKTVNTEHYNGTSWTEVNDINTVRNGYGGCGVYSSALYAGGEIR